MQATLKDMHAALGEFLTECGRVENMMFALAIFIVAKELEKFFDEYSSITFGPKIQWLKKRCLDFKFSDEDRKVLDRAFGSLDELLPKRNFLVHAETYEIAFGQEPSQPYRVGVTRRNFQYLDNFVRDRHADN